jgi:hypothetical protein
VASGRGRPAKSISLGVALALAAGILVVTAAIFVLGNSGTTRVSLATGRLPDYCAMATGAEMSARSLAIDSADPATAGDAIPLEALPVYFAIGNATSWTVSGQACYRFTVTVAAPNLTIGDTAFEVKTVMCANVSQEWAVDYLNASGALLATENPTDHSWGNAGFHPISVGDRLLVDSVGPLIADQLASKVSFQGSGTESSVVLGDYAGPVEGPCFS